MPVYELTNSSIQTLEPVSFSDVGLKERSDLQRLLRKQIEVISPETLVIAEEFGEWEDSKRRIDLLGVDRDALCKMARRPRAFFRDTASTTLGPGVVKQCHFL